RGAQKDRSGTPAPRDPSTKADPEAEAARVHVLLRQVPPRQPEVLDRLPRRPHNAPIWSAARDRRPYVVTSAERRVGARLSAVLRVVEGVPRSVELRWGPRGHHAAFWSSFLLAALTFWK